MGDAEYRIAVVGTGNVGKSSITIQFIQDFFVPEYDPTIEDSYRKMFQLGSRKYLLDILDTAGEEDYSFSWDQYFRECHGFLMVFDITEPTSLNIDFYVDRILKTKQVEKIPMVIAANKCDLEDLRKFSTNDGNELAKKYDCPFFETSAKTRINIPDIFISLIEEIETINLIIPKPVKKKQRECNIS